MLILAKTYIHSRKRYLILREKISEKSHYLFNIQAFHLTCPFFNIQIYYLRYMENSKHSTNVTQLQRSK